MFGNTRYVQNGLSIMFPRQPAIRRRANDFEDRLTGKYFQPSIIPVPDDVDPEFPRIVFGSEHGFSQIIVSQVSLTLMATYSAEWQSDIARGQAYLVERVPLMFDLIGVLDVTPHYSGLMSRVQLPSTMSDDLIVGLLARVFLKEEDTSNVHEISVKLTHVLSGTFFGNAVIQNYRSWKASDSEQGIVPRPVANAIDRGVQITGDLNDRYGFNEKPDYQSSAATTESVIVRGLDEVKKVVATIRGESS
jgi:hypothetical protein